MRTKVESCNFFMRISLSYACSVMPNRLMNVRMSRSTFICLIIQVSCLDTSGSKTVTGICPLNRNSFSFPAGTILTDTIRVSLQVHYNQQAGQSRAVPEGRKETCSNQFILARTWLPNCTQLKGTLEHSKGRLYLFCSISCPVVILSMTKIFFIGPNEGDWTPHPSTSLTEVVQGVLT